MRQVQTEGLQLLPLGRRELQLATLALLLHLEQAMQLFDHLLLVGEGPQRWWPWRRRVGRVVDVELLCLVWLLGLGPETGGAHVEGAALVEWRQGLGRQAVLLVCLERSELALVFVVLVGGSEGTVRGRHDYGLGLHLVHADGLVAAHVALVQLRDLDRHLHWRLRADLEEVGRGLIVWQAVEAVRLRQHLCLVLRWHEVLLHGAWVVLEVLLHVVLILWWVDLVTLKCLLGQHTEMLGRKSLDRGRLLRMQGVPRHLHVAHAHHLVANALLQIQMLAQHFLELQQIVRYSLLKPVDIVGIQTGADLRRVAPVGGALISSLATACQHGLRLAVLYLVERVGET